MRFHWLLLSVFSSFLLALPAQAGKLVFWRFDSGQNRLVFTTDDRVQPTAQLIPNPTRVVIDLPGIVLGQPSVTENFSGTIKSVRIGQFDAQTTRLVIEIAQGYTVDPQQVKIRGISPTQWTVDLPQPQRVNSSPDTLPPLPPVPSPSTTRPNATTTTTTTSNTSDTSGDFQVTRNGLFVRLERNGDERKISSKRSRDRQKIEFELPGATLSENLLGQTFPVNNYGVSQIQFEQVSGSTARITLSVSSSSPDWQALYSRFGGLVLLPQGGLSSFNNGNAPNSPAPISINIPRNQQQQAIIQSIDLNSSNTQLNISSDRPIRGSGNWNFNQGVYEIRIDNALLSDSFRGPRLGTRSAIYQLRVRQEDADTVLIMVQPALGYQLGQLLQSSDQLLALELRSLRTPYEPNPVTRPPVVSIPPSNPPSNPPISLDPTPPPRPNPPKGRTLVILDPGHGGKDPGAIGIGGLQEKDIILPISQMVSQILEQQGIQVMMTRSSDYFVSLEGRTNMANRAGASLFVSIHANSMGAGRPDVSGLEVYYFGDRRLSDTIYRSIVRSVNVKERGVRRARFYVLRNSKMPSTLIEVGFVTGQEDAAKLRNSNYQRQMADAIARGVIEYIRQNRL
ncbi:N-acetylmuramoyl-L-alanine amidase [Aphanothece hegewaldii CCALA 016]|uniref:N-acetylmuramoyl-L-alanine amidase n=1 Tax=Aphanothece hegewaldii CCALA 016 TaxID=2107694 RepID=A0A2T1M315_9CHRO|nr:N-acetylmuramoyl-L-alanine amidase [Aphanothece hegewaldii]PSF39229.1 N-acetylmuramoyl-L-alanine amidase [Aphanothece hegewaldii CCALA 016]